MTKYAIHTKWSWPNGVPSAETMQAKHRELRSQTKAEDIIWFKICLLYTSPSPRDVEESRMPSSA